MDWLNKFAQAIGQAVQQPMRAAQGFQHMAANGRNGFQQMGARAGFQHMGAQGQRPQPQTNFLDLYNSMAPGGGLGNVQHPYNLNIDNSPTYGPPNWVKFSQGSQIPVQAMINDASGFNYPNTYHAEQESPYFDVNYYSNPQGMYRRPYGSNVGY